MLDKLFADHPGLLDKLRRFADASLRQQNAELAAKVARYERILDMVCAQLNIEIIYVEMAPSLIERLRRKYEHCQG